MLVGSNVNNGVRLMCGKNLKRAQAGNLGPSGGADRSPDTGVFRGGHWAMAPPHRCQKNKKIYKYFIVLGQSHFGPPISNIYSVVLPIFALKRTISLLKTQNFRRATRAEELIQFLLWFHSTLLDSASPSHLTK